MTIISDPLQYNENDLFVDLHSVVDQSLFLKCEGFNFAGSIKLKAAVGMIEAAEREGLLHPWSILVESSSGNLGVALAMAAASKGYRFLCVTDPRCNDTTRRLIHALGSGVHVVSEPDPVTGLLGARLDHIRRLCASNARYVWLDQYANPNNWRAHHRTTAPAIARQFPDLDVLFVGAGTTGTLMGCARWFRWWHPRVRIVAVDAVGLGELRGPARSPAHPRARHERAPAAAPRRPCRRRRPSSRRRTRSAPATAWPARGFVFGGSTGTVVSGAAAWLDRHGGADLTAVAIAPDLGERYLDTVYSPSWLGEHFGDGVLEPPVEVAADVRSA